MTSRSIAVSFIALAMVLSGCATSHAPDGTSASIPTTPSRLSGTWYGSAYEAGAASPLYSSTLTLRINDDGTWTMTETRGGRTVQFSGTSTVRGDRITLDESNRRRWVSLQQSGNRLYGLENVARSGADSARVMVEFTRSP